MPLESSTIAFVNIKIEAVGFFHPCEQVIFGLAVFSFRRCVVLGIGVLLLLALAQPSVVNLEIHINTDRKSCINL